MKVLTIMLTALMLLGTGIGLAFAEAPDSDGAAILANDAGLSLEGLRRDQALFYDQAGLDAETPPEEDDTKGILACHFTNGCGYTVNPQVVIDLQYRIVMPEVPTTNFASSDALGDRLAPNLTFALRYNF